jgi:anti-sigma-K factor RskA
MSTGCDGNAAPYVLGALPGDEYAGFRAHLETCSICREEVAALQLVADALPATVPQVSAPPALKRRVMSSLQAQQVGVGAPSPRRSRRPAVASRGALALVGAAAAVVLAIVALLGGGGGGTSTRVIHAQVLAPGASASLVVSGERAQLDVTRMPQAGAGRVYEVWIKRAGAPQPTNALFTISRGGSATVAVPGHVHGVKQVLVTSEPLGGSPAPTREPVIIASLG